MPDTLKPDDALMHVSTNKHFAEHVVNSQRENPVPDQIGPKRDKSRHPRERAKAVRQNKLKASELPGKENRKPLANNHISRKPMWNAEQLRQKLQTYDRTPFLDVLALWMECIPTPQTIMAFADKYPDRWASAMHAISRMGGFAEKKDIDINLQAQIRNMSDSQIEDQLRQIAYKMGAQLPNIIDVTALEAEPSQQSPIPSSDEPTQTSNEASDGTD